MDITSAYDNDFRFEFADNMNILNDEIIGCEIPGLSLGVITKMIGGNEVKLPGDTLTIDDISINFKISGDYSNWVTIIKWMLGNRKDRVFSQGGLFLLGADGNPIFTINLENIFPNNISSIQHTRTNSEPDLLTFTSNFKINDISFE